MLWSYSAEAAEVHKTNTQVLQCKYFPQKVKYYTTINSTTSYAILKVML